MGQDASTSWELIAATRRLRMTRQAAHGLMVQLTRAHLVDLLPKDGEVWGARLTQTGRRRLATCRRALEATERTLAALPAETQRSLLESLGACEEAFVPRLEPWWME